MILLATLLLSAGFCGLYLCLALRLELLDRPNERSSHERPTPNGGGLPLLLAFALGVALAGAQYGPWRPEYGVLLLAEIFLMVVGVADDIRHLSVRVRMGLYALCCAGVAWYLAPQPQSVLSAVVLVGAVAFVLLWSVNLYNFMDGIDGLAALQCVLACVGAALLSWGAGSEGGYALFCLLLAAGHAGFLMWNWPPARLFMGDAGSVPTGLLLASLAVLGGVQGQLTPLCWLVLLAGFITDASWTLVWRIVTGQRFLQPHRMHAYQRLSRHLGSHLAVDLGLILLNALWLFPLAWAVQAWPRFEILLVILAYVPLFAGMVKLRRLA